MRPVWIRFKGLNSFLEVQEIDFGQLTKEGLFGIFGPTGSGKSSILDGITLALYGTTARNSGNFISLNTDRAYVDYVFSMKGKQERAYRVFRSFKRSKEGSVRSESARLVLLGEGAADTENGKNQTEGEQVLADRVGTVNEKCREIIGLSKEDFFRTVVLPQGKFSEFLKLEGMERNKMLERLFHLEQYGERLSELMKRQERIWEGEKKEKEGALSRYAGADRKQAEALGKREKELKELLKEKAQELEKTRLALEVMRRQEEEEKKLEELRRQAKSLEEEREEIQRLGQALLDAEKADRLWEYSLLAAQAKEQQENRQREARTGEEALKNLQEEEQQAERLALQAEEEAEHRLPGLREAAERWKEAEKLAVERRKKREAAEKARQEYRLQEQERNQCRQAQEEAEEQLKKGRQEKEHLFQELQKLAVSAKRQEQTAEGFRLWKEKQDLEERIQKAAEQERRLKQEQGQAEEASRLYKEQEEKLCRELAKKEAEREAMEQELAELSSLEKKKEYLAAVTEEQEKYSRLLGRLEESRNLFCSLKDTLERTQKQKEAAYSEKEALQRQYREHLALLLSAGLKEGEPCPVCGSLCHCLPEREEKAGEAEALEKRQRESEARYQKQAEAAAQLAVRLEGEQETQRRLAEEQAELNQALLEENQEKVRQEYERLCLRRETLKKNLEAQEKEEKNQREKAETLRTERVRGEAVEAALKRQIQENAAQTQELKSGLEEKQKQVGKVSQETGIQDFAGAYQELQERNRLREEKQMVFHKAELQEETLRKRLEERQEQLSEQEAAFLKAQLQAEAGNEELQAMERQISQVLGKKEAGKSPEEIQAELFKTTQQIEALEQRKKQRAKAWEEARNEAARIRIQAERLKAVAKAAQTEWENRQEGLQKRLEAEQVEGEDWILEHRRTKEEQKAWREKREAFQTREIQVQAQLSSFSGRSAETVFSKEKQKSLEVQEAELQEFLTEKNREAGAVKTERESLLKFCKEKEKLEEELGEVLHRLGLLKELDSLFKGKRFVEYVSRYYLDAISMRADACLKEMTGNGYGIETDGNGMFVIRDYKNGGAVRPASTLSGGETFMASLALALALSSQIQMKGGAPMELFFLDEGFGTLDGACLDVVMEALENIRNDSRCVGLITHVEEIKARIPTRLMVEPARMGEGGSRVRLERF